MVGQTGFYRVDMLSEAETAIGTGRRTVFLERIGPKWVTIRNPYTLRAARLKRGDWNRIARTARPINRPRNVKRAVTIFLRATNQKRTVAIRRMCNHRGKVSA